MSKNPDQVKSVKVDAIIRQGIKRYSDQVLTLSIRIDFRVSNVIQFNLHSPQVGLLWNSLADYYTRSSHFERARDIYEEAIQTVVTVRDFTQVFDAYAQFEESMVSAKIESTAAKGPTEAGARKYILHAAW